MFGNKFRSWMEAVRPRKKQHRKEKQLKSLSNNVTSSIIPTITTTTTTITTTPTSTNLKTTTLSTPINNYHQTNSKIDQQKRLLHDDNNRQHQQQQQQQQQLQQQKLQLQQQQHQQQQKQQKPNSNQICDPSRYSANNLSSPESAYSTGYSTDGTSPGAPPDYYVNIKPGVKFLSPYSGDQLVKNDQFIYNQQNDIIRPSIISYPPCKNNNIHKRTSIPLAERVPAITRTPIFEARLPPSADIVASPVLTSPRQRNRIRTNPWLPGSNLSPRQLRQTTPINAIIDSPIPKRFFSPSTIRHQIISTQSLSSSSCSSLSRTDMQRDVRKYGSGSEDDYTLNEMLGKYDESYIYEKETDILSDSDPTDCDDTDIDTGQDGGDEDDPLEREFDFIDNGSYLELDPKDNYNTGHCTYYNFDIQKRSFRRRTTRRNKQSNEKRRRSSSNKKRHKQQTDFINFIYQLHDNINNYHDIRAYAVGDGVTRSAGATPLSVRRTKHPPISKLALDDTLKRRSNSVSFSNTLATIDNGDKEADKKYKELIVEADNIMRNMKITVQSPRRVPGPANKRVELLRNLERTPNKVDLINKNIEEQNLQFVKTPSSNNNTNNITTTTTTTTINNNNNNNNNGNSNNNTSCPRFSPKRNHITNFIRNNSPVLMRRIDMEITKPPLIKRPESPKLAKKDVIRRSPKYRKKSNKIKLKDIPSSSDSDTNNTNKKSTNPFNCPQSEPVRRKVYENTENNNTNLNFHHFTNGNENLNFNSSNQNSMVHYYGSNQDLISNKNLRQQILLNTIASLKRSLEDQSASLKQVYRSSQNIYL